ncbi:hypothetical protein EJB05_11289 [Eragrostis curvula]|uniref:Uncharacterized protein n=1 Tax=Eragrostis curvula TaxID=38414 RepID=A0A5J9VR93_9POAL|nr:hypothetical protein EJB05_11289 [Eragrostis curvula]
MRLRALLSPWLARSPISLKVLSVAKPLFIQAYTRPRRTPRDMVRRRKRGNAEQRITRSRRTPQDIEHCPIHALGKITPSISILGNVVFILLDLECRDLQCMENLDASLRDL